MDNWLDRFIHFVIDHNEVIVQTMLVLSVAWAAVMIGTWLFSKGEAGSDSAGQDLAAGGAAGAVVGTESTAAMVAALTAAQAAAQEQVTRLQSELVTRAQEVEKLKFEMTKSQAEAVDISEYVKKIKDLEGKLAEYEILEDDIADLSLYKEENVRLKAELARLGGAATAAPSPAVGPQAKPIPAPSPSPDAPLEEFATVVRQAKQAEAANASESGDDLLTEFAASLNEADSGGLDTDKMLSEMAALEGAAADRSGLEESSDIDKMAAEASKLAGG